MVDINGLKVFTNTIDDFKSSDSGYKATEKSDKKDSFSDYLKNNLSSKKIKEKSVSKEANYTDKKIVTNDESKLTSVADKTLEEANSLSKDELVSKIVDKIDNLANDGEVEVDSIETTKLITLLLALLNKLNDGSDYETTKVSEGNLVESIDLLEGEPLDLLTKTFDNNLSNDLPSLLSEDVGNKSFNDNLLEIRDILQSLIKAEESLNLNNINLEVVDDKSLDLIKKDLVKEVKSLFDAIPEGTKTDIMTSIDKALITNDTDSNIKEIFNSLLNKVVEKDELLEDGSKVDTKVNNTDNTKESIILDKTISENNEELNKEGFSNKENATNKEDISKKEEKVLMKFLDDDSSATSTKNFNYYNKLNGLPSSTDEVKMPVTVNKKTLDMDIIKNVKFMMKDAISELKVKVYPKELGEMTIKILSEEGIMKAEIKATSKETYNLLNSNLNEIKKLLENQNIKIQDVNIGLYNEDTTFFSGEDTNQNQDFKNTQGQNLSGISSVEEEEIMEELILDNNLNILA
ncbi:MAG: flagellar hook-length control protein FliK [Clostridium sp.]|uniref:flagellar hook-length control protein FliK n=1 Tax=Clostridium sp. TaxID=1506 RepID=UPI002911A62B|nr:flagellar hook-length control protein FliK [Clostridium sp.]MDU5109246.1 flagellar hook-length control protein FliK [Clostridium sp.]